MTLHGAAKLALSALAAVAMTFASAIVFWSILSAVLR